MLFLLIFPALSYLLFCAHLMYNGAGFYSFWPLVAVLFLFVPRKSVMWLHVGLLVLASLEWIRTGVVLVMNRMEMAQPYTVAGCIMAAVTIFTLLSATVFLNRRVQFYYQKLSTI